MTLKRIHREIADLKKEDLGDIALGPKSGDNPFLWKARIPGPDGSVYEGGMFDVEVHLAHDYPFSAPKVLFLTRIYHMNISDRGNVCIDILKHNWSPALSIFKVILSLSSLLTDPNPSDPLVPSIASDFLRRRTTHDQTARRWTELYATPPPPVSVEPTPPPPPPPAAASGASSSSNTPAPASGAAKGKARAHVEAIEIADSDEEHEVELVTATGRGTKRRRVRAGSVIDLSTDGDAGESSRRNGKRRAVDRTDAEEVIVIED
ncbi:hypothetical protein FA95DRAFT_1576965 [Auriscalpium vulgare]|uniref:Uncharacterized protein n=1 Tax=Auriscalpium vulgare TaxID=40419 RepID=A0ACB8R9I2_9AGAM|nr:hypothetical protein FA95DRAFT_1576965 [Auriscalpium vulgare]